MPEPRLPDRRIFDPGDSNPCAGCSNCCEYIALEIDKPATVKDFDYIYWYLIHEDVWVYIDEDNDWYVQFNTPCRKLEGMRCGAYASRPMVCREYEPESCVRYGEGPAEKVLFKDEMDLFRYLAKRRPAMFKKLKDRIHLPPETGEWLERELQQVS